jgi:hypothetical protein
MTPPIAHASSPARHPRGIYEAEHTFPGQTTFTVFDCTGRLLEQRKLETELVDGHTRASLEWTLEHYCPADREKHAATCCGSPAALRLV